MASRANSTGRFRSRQICTHPAPPISATMRARFVEQTFGWARAIAVRADSALPAVNVSPNIGRISDCAKKVLRPSTVGTGVRNRESPKCDFFQKSGTIWADSVARSVASCSLQSEGSCVSGERAVVAAWLVAAWDPHLFNPPRRSRHRRPTPRRTPRVHRLVTVLPRLGPQGNLSANP